MRDAIYLPLAVSLLAALSARWVAGRLEPRTATWLLTVSALLLAAATGAALAALAATVIGQVPVLASIGHWSVRALRQNDPTSLSLAVAACILLGGAMAAACRAGFRRVRALAAAAGTARCLPCTGQFAVLDDPEPDAYTLPGLPGRIVVTSGMLDALDDREVQVLVAHERAHLACGHYLFVTAAHLAAAANPLLRPVEAAVRYAVERWADEYAAGRIGDRRVAAVTVGKAALLTTASRRASSSALSMVTRSLRRAGPVPRRVAALLAAPPGPRPLLVAAAVLVLGLAATSTLEVARDLHALFELAESGAN
jgi:Peptidase family M48